MASARRRTPRLSMVFCDRVGQLADAGVDSLRVSLASALPARYDAYHRPRGYNMCDVAETLRRAKARWMWVALNALALPGVTDAGDEASELAALARLHRVDAVEFRNLNLDPGDALAVLAPTGRAIGIRRLVARLREALPGVPVASFNRPVRKGREG